MSIVLTAREKKIRAQRVDLATPYERKWLDRWHRTRGSWWHRVLVTERREDGNFYCLTLEVSRKRILGCEAGCMGISLKEIKREVRAWEARERYERRADIRQHIGAYI